MEIVHIILGKANPNRMNGVNKVVHQIAYQQTLAGKNVSVFGISKNGKNEKHETPFSLTIFRAFINPFRIDKDLKSTIQKQKENTIFILHGSWIPRFYSVSRFFRKNNCKYVSMQHGGYNEEAMQKSKFLKTVYFRLFENHLLKGAQAIHCIGNSEVQGLSKIGFESKSRLIPYGFNVQHFEAKRIEKSPSTFCYMGRFDAHTKGLDSLVDAFSEVHKIRPEAKLWMIGSGGDIEQLKSAVKEKNLEKNVVFWGALFGKEKFDLMKKATVFVHPSRFEGLPSAIMEAASVSLPIIATKATNMTSYLAKHNAGWWIENNNTNSLTNAMMTSIVEPTNLNLAKGRNAKTMIENEFDWNNVLCKMDKMYSDAFKK